MRPPLRYLGKPSKLLWENKESLEKYINKLRELMAADGDESAIKSIEEEKKYLNLKCVEQFSHAIKTYIMEGSIKIDFRDEGNGKGLQPVIFVKVIDSDDPRDKLLKSFFQSMGGESSWLAVKFDHHVVSDRQKAQTWISITPVRSEELEETAKIIMERLEKRKQQPPIEGQPINFNSLSDRYDRYFKKGE